MGQAGLYVQAKAAQWYTKDMDNVKVTILDGKFDASKQTQEAVNALNQGDVTGLLLDPYDAKASRQIVKAAKSQNVPVMNFDTATLSKDIILGAFFGQYMGGKAAAEKFKKEMKKRNLKNPKVITNIFNLSSTTSQKRLHGFTDNIPDSVQIVDQVVSDGSADAASPKMRSSLQANQDVDAIFSNNVGSGMGALIALKQMDMYHKKGSDEHVMAFGDDGGPQLNKRIADGYYDFAIDQPLHMYAPLCLELMWKYLDKGMDGIPKVGTTVKPGDQLSLKNKEIDGIHPWKKQFWGPAPMTQYKSDGTTWWPWLKTGHAVITQKNATAPYLYGNVYRHING